MQIRDPAADRLQPQQRVAASGGWSQHEWAHRKRQILRVPVPLAEMDCWDFEIRHCLLTGRSHAVEKGIRLEFFSGKLKTSVPEPKLYSSNSQGPKGS